MKSEEKMAFLKAVLSLTKVDGDVDVKEVAAFQKICDFLGIGNMEVSSAQQAVLTGKETMDDYLAEIRDRKSQLYLLYAMVSIAYADGDYSDSEKQEIRRVLSRIDINEDKLHEIEAVAAEEVVLLDKIDKVLERE